MRQIRRIVIKKGDQYSVALCTAAINNNAGVIKKNNEERATNHFAPPLIIVNAAKTKKYIAVNIV